MKVEFDDTPGNWALWSALVTKWINNPSSWPKDTNQLLGQMTGISKITKPDPKLPPKPVHITQDDGITVQFLLPSLSAVQEGKNGLPGNNQPYPLRTFYDHAFANTAKRGMQLGEMLEFASNRLGEYTIQECHTNPR